MAATLERRRTGVRGRLEVFAAGAWCAAVPGTIYRGAFVPPTATGTPPACGSTSMVSVLRERSLHESLPPVGVQGAKPLDESRGGAAHRSPARTSASRNCDSCSGWPTTSGVWIPAATSTRRGMDETGHRIGAWKGCPVASVREIAIKCEAGWLWLPEPRTVYVGERMRRSGVVGLPISHVNGLTAAL